MEIPAPDAPTDLDRDGIVTTEDLRELLEAPSDASLVVEDGHALVVADAASVDAVPILSHDDLTTMLDGGGADRSETLDQLAAGLDNAARQQVV